MYHNYPTADDERVAIGYAENTAKKEKSAMVTIDENAFKTYMFANYFNKLDQASLLEILQEQMGIESLVDMAQNNWELPFDFSEGKVKLTDPDALLLKHSEPEECFDCPETILEEQMYPDNSITWESEGGLESNEENWSSYADLDEHEPYYEEGEENEEA